MTKTKYKKGFTLLETVVTLAIISIISVGFMQLTVSMSTLNKSTNNIRDDIALLFSAAQGNSPIGEMEKEQIDEIKVNLGDGINLTLKEYTMRYADEDGGVTYYAYE